MCNSIKGKGVVYRFPGYRHKYKEMMAFCSILFVISTILIIRVNAESTSTDPTATPLLITERSVDTPTKVILFLVSVEDIKREVFNAFEVKSEVQLTEPGKSCFAALDCRVSTMLDWSRTQNSTATGIVTWALSSVSTVISNPPIQPSPGEVTHDLIPLKRRKREEHRGKELDENIAWDMRHFADMIRRLFSRHFPFPDNSEQLLLDGANLNVEFNYTLRELNNIATKFLLVLNVQNASKGQLESTIEAALNTSLGDNKTLIIVTGRCPDEKMHTHNGNALFRLIREASITESPQKSVPLYAKGPRSNELLKPKYIWEVPDAIMAAIGGPPLPEHHGSHKPLESLSHKVFEKHYFGSLVEDPLENDERDQVTGDLFSHLFGEELASKLETARKRHLVAIRKHRPFVRRSTHKPVSTPSTKSADHEGKSERVALANTVGGTMAATAAPTAADHPVTGPNSASVPASAPASASASLSTTAPASASASVSGPDSASLPENPVLNTTRSKRAAVPQSNTVRRTLEAPFGGTADHEPQEFSVPPLALVVGAVGSLVSIVGIVAALVTGRLRRYHYVTSIPSV